MTAAAHPPRSDAGFTLIEMLVGLVLLGLLVAGLAPSLRLGGQAWALVERQGATGTEAQTAEDFLRRSLAEAYPAAFVDEDGRRRLAYVGTADAVAMIAPMPSYLGLGGLQVIRIGVDEHEGHRDLVALWSPLTPEARDFEGGEETRRVVLASGIAALELRYWGRSSPSELPNWFENWTDHTGLPKLVRLRVTFPPGEDRPAWPDLLVRPMVDLGAMVKR